LRYPNRVGSLYPIQKLFSYKKEKSLSRFVPFLLRVCIIFRYCWTTFSHPKCANNICSWTSSYFRTCIFNHVRAKANTKSLQRKLKLKTENNTLRCPAEIPSCLCEENLLFRVSIAMQETWYFARFCDLGLP
jgi:hypothetical protein